MRACVRSVHAASLNALCNLIEHVDRAPRRLVDVSLERGLVRWAQRAVDVAKSGMALLGALELEEVTREERGAKGGVVGLAALLFGRCCCCCGCGSGWGQHLSALPPPPTRDSIAHKAHRTVTAALVTARRGEDATGGAAALAAGDQSPGLGGDDCLPKRGVALSQGRLAKRVAWSGCVGAGVWAWKCGKVIHES